jgi:hypothetical protein
MAEYIVLDEKKFEVELDNGQKLIITKRFVDVDHDYMDDRSYTEFEFDVGGAKQTLRYRDASKLSYFFRLKNWEQMCLKPSVQREERARRKALREASKGKSA